MYITNFVVLYFIGLLFANVMVLSGLEFSSDIPVVDGVAGDKAAIPCNVPTPLADDEASLILWYRADNPNPIYTLDVRKVPMKAARHFPAPELETRATFNTTVHPPVLVLSPVLLEDQGDYKCRVDLRRSRTLILHCRLNIIVLPSEPIIMDEHGQHLYGTIGPYDEGTKLTLICEVDGGDPSPEVTWWRGSALYDDDFNVTTQGFVRNELVLRKLQRSDLMVEFSCQASNTNISKPKASTVLLDINLKPLHATILNPKMPMIAGEDQEVICETKGSRPRALTSWWLEDRKYVVETSEIVKEDGNVTLSILHFVPKPEDNGKKLTCKSVNPVLPKFPVMDELKVKVHYVPMPKLILGASVNQTKIKEGSDLYLECHVQSNPPISEVAWQFGDRPLKPNRTSGVIVSNQTLVLQKVTKEHRGRYRCLAANTVGQGSSNQLHLLIQFSPVCKSSETRIYGIAQNETMNITCDVEAEPRDVVYKWSLKSNQENVLLQNWSRGIGVNVLAYSPKNASDYGIISCWGKNSIGSQKQPCLAKIVPAGPPESPRECVLTNQTSSTLTVECEPGYNGSLPQTFHVEIYNSIVEHMAENMTTFDRPTFQIAGLAPRTTYVLVISASNSKGRSTSVALVASTLSPAERRTAKEDQAQMNPILGIVIGVVAIFVVIAIVVVIIVKSKSPPEGNSKDSTSVDPTMSSEMSKKEIEESQDPGAKGPDIIPLSIDSDVFFTGGFASGEKLQVEYLSNQDSPQRPRQKYTDTVL